MEFLLGGAADVVVVEEPFCEEPGEDGFLGTVGGGGDGGGENLGVGEGETRQDGEVVCFDDAVDGCLFAVRAGGLACFVGGVEAFEQGGQEGAVEEGACDDAVGGFAAVVDGVGAAEEEFDEAGDDAEALLGGEFEEGFEGDEEGEADAVAEDFLWGEQDVGFGDLEGLGDAVGRGFEDGEEGWDQRENFGGGGSRRLH